MIRCFYQKFGKNCHYLIPWKVIKIRYVNISIENFTMVELRMKNYHTSSTLFFRTKSMNNFLGGEKQWRVNIFLILSDLEWKTFQSNAAGIVNCYKSSKLPVHMPWKAKDILQNQDRKNKHSSWFLELVDLLPIAKNMLKCSLINDFTPLRGVVGSSQKHTLLRHF